MKKLLLFIFIFLSFFSKAQTSIYHSFPDSNAVWNIHFHSTHVVMTTVTDEYYSITLSNDTIIHSHSYHKLIIPHIQTTNVGLCQQFFFPYAGAIRQDTINKLVYFFPPSDTTEILLYDFNLQVGDSIRGFFENLYPDKVLSIDSVLIENTYRKRWNFYGPLNQIIEGIGSTYGLCQIPEPTSFTNCYSGLTLTCFYQNNVTVFPDTSTTCQIINSIPIQASELYTSSVQPNPFHLFATFILPTEIKSAEFNLYNTLGILIMRKVNLNRTFQIDRTRLSNGIYFYQLISNERGN